MKLYLVTGTFRPDRSGGEIMGKRSNTSQVEPQLNVLNLHANTYFKQFIKKVSNFFKETSSSCLVYNKTVSVVFVNNYGNQILKNLQII